MERLRGRFSEFMPYLEDLRRRLFGLVILFVILFVCGFVFSGPILRTLTSTIALPGVTIAATSPFQIAGLAVDVGFFTAFIGTIPVAAYLVLSFIFPAITAHERNLVLAALPASMALFLLGAAYGFAILYFSLGLLARFNASIGLSNVWDVSSYLSALLTTATLLGALFQLPLVLSALLRLGIASRTQVASWRRMFYFAAVVVVAFLPPTDGVSLVIMAAPLLLLYEVVLLLHWKDYKKRAFAN